MQDRFERGNREAKASILLIALALILVVVTIRLLHLQVVKSDRLREISENNRLRTEAIPALRGRLLDRNGKVLADNTPSFSVVVDPLISEYRKHPEKLEATAEALARLIEEDPARLLETVKEKAFKSPLGVKLAGNLKPYEIAAIEESSSRLPGVRIEVRPRRHYPHKELACHLLGTVGEVAGDEIGGDSDTGYVAGDFVGRRGIERQYETHLRGEDGRRQTQVDALGRRSGLYGGLEKEPALPGEDLHLTLDLELQRFVEDTLSAYRRGAVVVIEMETGGVLAMASMPPFDPNAFSRGLTRDEWKGLENDEDYPLINRCTQARYPPGSTFKLLTAIAALEEGLISPEEKPVYCGGYYVLGNRRFGCWKETGHGRLGMREAIAQSCSSYFFNLGRLIGVEKLCSWAKHLGLDDVTGIDLPAEMDNFAPDTEWFDSRYGVDGWGPGLALNLAIGQGELLVTPLKLATIAMAVGGRGRWPIPHVVEGPPAGWGEWYISRSALEVVREGMFRCVQGEHGTGRLAAVEGVTVGGKTGTAQNPHGGDHSIFIGFAPWSKPTVALAVYLENAGHGGREAAPLAGAVLNHYFDRLAGDFTRLDSGPGLAPEGKGSRAGGGALGGAPSAKAVHSTAGGVR